MAAKFILGSHRRQGSLYIWVVRYVCVLEFRQPILLWLLSESSSLPLTLQRFYFYFIPFGLAWLVVLQLIFSFYTL